MSDLPRHSVSVTAAVFHEDGRVLAIRREDDGRWVPPGGVVELDETPEHAVIREVLEETGVQVEPESADRGLQEHEPWSRISHLQVPSHRRGTAAER
ncbi:NUDIX domain-containing protein [Planotetraspora mira]|uniref:NUDIX domain-containing protein n=1 Tax=Planotetraspora mira TaxID=58121 RepID=UPI0027E47FD0|nr:NUDIX domain-containing protein [Planotetraspora mira]